MSQSNIAFERLEDQIKWYEAERVESLVSPEHAKWASSQEQTAKKKVTDKTE